MLRSAKPGSWPVAGVLIAACVMLGGGAWGYGDVLLAIAGLWFCLAAALAQSLGALPRWGRLEAVLLALFALLAVTQLLPVPFEAWARLPGRGVLAADLRALGQLQPRVLGLDADAALRAVSALLPAVAVLLWTRPLGAQDRWWLSVWVVLVGAGASLWGVLQVAAPELAPRLHAFHNTTGALGGFAYRNHQAIFLVMLLPLAVALSLDAFDRNARWLRILLPAIVALLAVGAVLTQSRAGAGLTLLAVLGGGLLWRVSRRTGRRPGRVSTTLLATAGVLVTLLVWRRAAPQGWFEDGRWAVYSQVLEAAAPYQPVGAGLGGFEQAFQAMPANVTLPGAYMHHAHNEWLQLWLELGWLGGLACVTAVAWLLHCIWQLWGGTADAGHLTRVGRAATLSLLLVGLHAVVDYPLRATANLAVLALLAGLLAKQAAGSRPIPDTGMPAAAPPPAARRRTHAVHARMQPPVGASVRRSARGVTGP